MPEKIKWSQVPHGKNGYVDYRKIPSMPVRQIVAKAEREKITEALNAYNKRKPEFHNKETVIKMTDQLWQIELILQI